MALYFIQPAQTNARPVCGPEAGLPFRSPSSRETPQNISAGTLKNYHQLTRSSPNPNPQTRFKNSPDQTAEKPNYVALGLIAGGSYLIGGPLGLGLAALFLAGCHSSQSSRPREGNQSDKASFSQPKKTNPLSNVIACTERDIFPLRFPGLPGPPPKGIRLTQVDAGRDFMCGLRPDQKAACWGEGYGLGQSHPEDAFTQISVEGVHSCGVKTDGTLKCWGRNKYANVYVVRPLPAGVFSQVSVGLNFACGVKEDGALACWGDIRNGQINHPKKTFSQVSTGYGHACAVRMNPSALLGAGGAMECWGRNDHGQADPPKGAFIQVSAGATHSVGLKKDGTIVSWGSNDFGQTNSPAGIFTQISAGWDHTCGLKKNGEVACWGRNLEGQTHASMGTFSQVSAGYGYTCAVRPDNLVECWGSNTKGQSTPPSP